MITIPLWWLVADLVLTVVALVGWGLTIRSYRRHKRWIHELAQQHFDRMQRDAEGAIALPANEVAARDKLTEIFSGPGAE